MRFLLGKAFPGNSENRSEAYPLEPDARVSQLGSADKYVDPSSDLTPKFDENQCGQASDEERNARSAVRHGT